MARDTFSVPILHIYSSVGYCVVYFCLGFVRAFYQINEIDSTLSFLSPNYNPPCRSRVATDFYNYEKMLALLAACLWLAGCSGDGPDGGSGNLNIVFDCSMPLQVVAGETCEVGYTLEGASENARVRVVAPDGYRVQVIETNYWSGKIVIYLPDAATDERIVVILSDEGNETVSRYIDLEVKAKSDVVLIFPPTPTLSRLKAPLCE